MTHSNRLTHDEDGKVLACPECDHAGNIIERTADNTYAGDPDDDCLCGACGETFDREDVVERDEKWKGKPPKYADLTPEDVGLESGDPP